MIFVKTPRAEKSIHEKNIGRGFLYRKIFERNFTYSIPPAYNKSNIKIVAFVTPGSSKAVLNVRGAKIGDEQSIEQN